MTALDKAFNIIGLALILIALLLSTASAQAVPPRGIDWLWPEKSISVAQSTASLVQGFPGRARLLAERALPSTNEFDRAIALHNLCLAALQQRVATSHCELAIQLAEEASRSVNGRPLIGVMRANIARSRMAAAAQTAANQPQKLGAE